ncbi:MAG: Lrp/AsnC ligand binding domain-containing protein [Candidatus Bathyarchaeia archaeon]
MKPGTSQEIVGSRRIRGVKMANSVLGRFDAVVVIETESLEELRKIIYEMVEQHPNVVHTETLISIFHPAEL